VEGGDGPVEVADLFFADGTATRRVPFASSSFVGERGDPPDTAAHGSGFRVAVGAAGSRVPPLR
jgi:hypothetical protein